MKKTYRIEGLDCANCAAKMERSIAGIDGVTACRVNFMTGKLMVEGADEQTDRIFTEAEKIVKRIEPGAVLKRG